MTHSAAVLARFRTRWLDWMTDTISITEPIVRTYNRSTNEYDETGGASRYSGIGRVFYTSRTEEKTTGEVEHTLRHFEVILPHDTTGILIDDQVTVDASGDPEMVGVTGRIYEIEAGGWNVTRRVYIEEVQV